MVISTNWEEFVVTKASKVSCQEEQMSSISLTDISGVEIVQPIQSISLNDILGAVEILQQKEAADKANAVRDQITTLAGDFRDANKAADAARIAEKEAAIKAKADAKAVTKVEKVEKTPDIDETDSTKVEKVEKTPDIGETDSEGGTLD